MMVPRGLAPLFLLCWFPEEIHAQRRLSTASNQPVITTTHHPGESCKRETCELYMGSNFCHLGPPVLTNSSQLSPSGASLALGAESSAWTKVASCAQCEECTQRSPHLLLQLPRPLLVLLSLLLFVMLLAAVGGGCALAMRARGERTSERRAIEYKRVVTLPARPVAPEHLPPSGPWSGHMRRGAHLEEMHWRLDFDASGTVTGASHESAAMEGRLDAARGKLVLVERRAHAASWASPMLERCCVASAACIVVYTFTVKYLPGGLPVAEGRWHDLSNDDGDFCEVHPGTSCDKPQGRCASRVGHAVQPGHQAPSPVSTNTNLDRDSHYAGNSNEYGGGFASGGGAATETTPLLSIH